MICSRDWQDLLDVLERIALSLEGMAQNNADRETARALTADVKANTAKLSAATPQT